MGNFEKNYGKTMEMFMKFANPVKKKIVKTSCYVHKYINYQSIWILKKNGHKDAFNFYIDNINSLNHGVYWADQDFKSSNHFFHLHTEKGMYGFSDALSFSKDYYHKAEKFIKNDDIKNGIFKLGATCHLIQDACVPHHVLGKLLKEHRSFEQWILRRVVEEYFIFEHENIISCGSIEEYIKGNGQHAFDTYYKYAEILDKNERYEKISTDILERAISSTAGVLLDFYEKNISKESLL